MDIWEKARKSMGCRPGEIRSQLGLSIEEFAKIMNVSVGVMCRWIGGGEEPYINEQIRMNEMVRIKNATFSYRAARAELELSTGELAEALDLKESDIVRYEGMGAEELVPFRYKLEIYKLLESAQKKEGLEKELGDDLDE